MVANNSKVNESILDSPKPGLDPVVWQDSSGKDKPTLSPEAQQKIYNAINWVQDQYHFNDLSVFIIGSICSNSWTDSSDIDIDFCTKGATEDDSDEDVVKEFGWAFKKNFIDNYMKASPTASTIGSHPLEVYFNPNPFQCFMSVGCYNVLQGKWEVGPDFKKDSFDPVSEYYFDAMKQVDKILKDIREKIFEIYELAFVIKKSKDESFKKEQTKKLCQKLDDASDLVNTMKRVRSNFQKEAKSKEEALKRRKDKKQHIVDASFKFLEKFGYISILKDAIDIYDKVKNNELQGYDNIADEILKSIKDNMALKHLQDSEDQELTNRIQEVENLNESGSTFVKISVIAALMAIQNLLPAAQLARELTKAKHETRTLTINSPATKDAIANASKGNEMIGPMSKTNVVNVVAQVLWKEARGVNEGTAGREAVASVILNRTGNDPTRIVDVIKEKEAFSCMNGYSGGWTDSTYQFFVPWKELSSNPSNNAIWEECKSIAERLVNKQLISTIGNRNAYLNKKTAKKKAVDTWGQKCTLKIGSHHFGYLPEHDPKYVVPGTMTTWKEYHKMHKGSYVVVKAGDTLGKIAKDNKTTISKILELNKGITNPNKIAIGQKIQVT